MRIADVSVVAVYAVRFTDTSCPKYAALLTSGTSSNSVAHQTIPEPVDLDCMFCDVVPGQKWPGIREYLHQWDGWRGYDYIWLPDDDKPHGRLGSH